jgi:hypothetical protein
MALPIDYELIAMIFRTVFNPAVEKLVKEVVSKSITPISYEATLTGDGAIAQGDGAKAVGAGGVLISGNVNTGGGAYVSGNVDTSGGDFVGRDQVSGNKIPGNNSLPGDEPLEKDSRIDKTFQKISETARFVTKQLEASYAQAREQAYTWFRFSIIAAGVGFLLIVIGVIVLMLGRTTEGIITTVSSIVPNVIAALFFVQSKASNERVDAIQSKLSESREIHTAVEIANSIETKKERDKLKAEIVRKVIGLSAVN